MIVRRLHNLAAATGAIYKIVFTGLLLYELIKFQLTKGGKHGPPLGPARSPYRRD